MGWRPVCRKENPDLSRSLPSSQGGVSVFSAGNWAPHMPAQVALRHAGDSFDSKSSCVASPPPPPPRGPFDLSVASVSPWAAANHQPSASLGFKPGLAGMLRGLLGKSPSCGQP